MFVISILLAFLIFGNSNMNDRETAIKSIIVWVVACGCTSAFLFMLPYLMELAIEFVVIAALIYLIHTRHSNNQ